MIEGYDYVECPYCGGHIATDIGLNNDGDQTVEICGQCEKEVKITLKINAEFSAEKG